MANKQKQYQINLLNINILINLSIIGSRNLLILFEYDFQKLHITSSIYIL